MVKELSPEVLVWMEWMEGEELDEEWTLLRWESPSVRVSTIPRSLRS